MLQYVSVAVLAAVSGLATAGAADIDGNIVVKHKLTKRKVTTAAASYERGATVELRSDQGEDPLAFERGRVVVYLEGQFPQEPVNATLEQKNRRFIPETLVVPAGSTVSFPNLDPIFHNVFSLSKPKTFDLGNYPKDHTRTVTFPTPGIVFVNCHLHPNMAAAIVISPNRWSAKADATGRFTLSGVPPGSYTIVAWHRAAGFFRQTVKITENRGADVQFIIPLDADGMPTVQARR
jgi:plastocyanin